MKYRYKKRLKSCLSIVLSICLCLMVIMPAFAQDVSYAVKVLFQPITGQETVSMGEAGYMNLSAAVASSQTGDATIKIMLDADVDSYMPQFTEASGYKLTASGVVISLLHDEATGTPYLEFVLKAGDSVNVPIQFQYPNGITESNKIVSVNSDDIKVTTEIPGNIQKEGGSLTFNAKFEWDNVVKEEKGSTPLSVKGDSHLNRELSYTVNVNSKNVGSGVIFTKKVVITDTMTLPAGVVFVPAGAASIVQNGLDWQIKVHGALVATIVPPALREGITGNVASASIESNKLTFVYEQEAGFTDASAYVNEMPNPNLSVIIAPEQIFVNNPDTLDGSLKIANEVMFHADPWVGTEAAESTASVDTPIVSPDKEIKIEKTSNIFLKDGSMALKYTLVVSNTSAINLTNIIIRDYLPDTVELVVEDNPTYVIKTIDGQTVLEWTGQNINAGEKVQKEVSVKVKPDVALGTEIVNKGWASAEPDKWVDSIVTDTVVSPKKDLFIKKTNSKGESGAVYEGDTITYTIQIRNSGLQSSEVNTTDNLPEYIVNPREYQYSLDGQNWVVYPENSVQFTGKTITFPKYSLDNHPATELQPEIWFRFTGDVKNTAGITNIMNTAHAASDSESISDSSIVTVRERKPKLLLAKTAGTPTETGASTNLYKIPYTLTIKNEGDAVFVEDVVEVKDTMSGGLIPIENAQETGTIRGKWTCGAVTQEIAGSFQRTDNISGGYSYTITWKIPVMPGGTVTNPATGTIEYAGYVQMPDGNGSTITSVSALNSAMLYLKGNPEGPGTGTTTPMKANPGMDKVIKTVNGKAPADKRFSEVHGKDEVTYLLTVENTGNIATDAILTDYLPQYYAGDFRWKLDENISIKGTDFGVAMLDSGKNQIVWNKVRIEAGAKLAVEVTLKFPGPIEFNKYFVNNTEKRTITNKLVMQAQNPDNLTQVKSWNAEVNHDITPLKLNLKKTVTPNTAIMGGEEATFTLSDFGTDYAAANMKLMDNFADVLSYMNLTSIQCGSFQGINEYKIILNYADFTSKEILITNPGESSVITENLTGVQSVTWDFGTVDSLKIISTPKLVMTAKTDTEGAAVNEAILYYNESTAEAKAPVVVTSNSILKKVAYKDGKPVDNSKNPLVPGDTVTFTIEYKNHTLQPITLDAASPLRDYLTTKGIETGSYSIAGSVTDSDSKPVDNKLLPAELVVSADDIASDKAKITKFMLEKPLNPGETLKIAYSVKISNLFSNSQGDKNQDLDENWGYDQNGKPTENPENLYMLHNRVIAVQGENQIQVETGFYYQEGKDQLFFQKAVGGLSYLGRFDGAVQVNIRPDRTDTGDLSYWGETESKADYGVDYVRYTVVISNDRNSPDALTVSSVEDYVPVNTIPQSYSHNLGNYNIIETFVALGQLYSTESAYYGGTASDNYDWTSYVYKSSPWDFNKVTCGHISDNIDRCKVYAVTIPADTVADVTTIPTGYKAVGSKIRLANTVTQVPKVATFNLQNMDGTGPLVLQPGEVFAFSYGIPVDRLSGDPVQWDNTAVLHTLEDVPVMKNPGFETNLHGRDLKRNMADGTRTDAGTYSATATIYPPTYKLGITKAASAMIQANQGDTISWPDLASKIPTAISNLSFGDVVCWDVTVKNAGSTTIKSATLQDAIPYPYKLITNGDKVVGKNITTLNAPVDVEGTVVDVTPAPQYGATGQNIKITGIELKSGESRVYRFYTQYKGSDLRSINYLNRAQVTLDGKVVVSEGRPVYDDSRSKIIGTSAEATVFPLLENATVSYKQITENGNTSNTAKDTDSKNYIQIGVDGTVRYTLSVKNTSKMDYTGFTMMDRLPELNDVGVVNAGSTRGSQFAVQLLSSPNVVVKLGDEVLTEGKDYTLDYSQANMSGGYTKEIWEGNPFTNPTADPTQARALRIVLNRTFTSGSTLTTEFDAKPAAEAKPGNIAWNSFGYSYLTQNMRVYAEPPKVGVQIPMKFTFTKVASDDHTQGLNGAEFTLYQLTCQNDSHDHNALIDTKNPGDCWGKTGNQVSGPKVSFKNLLSGEYRLIETKAPPGCVLPVGQWRVKLDPQAGNSIVIEAVGDKLPLAFIIEQNGDLLLPNRKMVELPTSGGVSLPLTVSGIVLMGGGVLLGLLHRHRKKREKSNSLSR